MAVQKSKKSTSRRGMRRAHNRLCKTELSIETNTGETHRRHQLSPNGYYRGKQILAITDDSDIEN